MPTQYVVIGGMWCQPDYGMCTWCVTMCSFRLRTANSTIYTVLESMCYVHAHSGKMQDTFCNFPSLVYSLYPQGKSNTFIMQCFLTKVYLFRLGNEELPTT